MFAVESKLLIAKIEPCYSSVESHAEMGIEV